MILRIPTGIPNRSIIGAKFTVEISEQLCAQSKKSMEDDH